MQHDGVVVVVEKKTYRASPSLRMKKEGERGG
jgi:hypothetical protein